MAINRDLARDILGVTLLAGALILLASYVLAKVLLRPVAHLLAATRAITNGDFSRSIEVFTRDEFGELGAAINYMADRIREPIKTLISVINSKDKYTFGHSERVVHYAVAVGRAMGLMEPELRVIRVGAYLHDIGKIEIDREVLNKEGVLNNAEMDILHQHPNWGAQIISSVRSLKEMIPVVLYHHENYDGTGYPVGLAGTDIPLAARILKVTDSYDAMTTPRPYQTTRTPAEARAELTKYAGKEFDPVVVEVFLDILEKLASDKDKIVC